MPGARTGTENERSSGGETLIGGKPERKTGRGGRFVEPYGDRLRMESAGTNTPRSEQGHISRNRFPPAGGADGKGQSAKPRTTCWSHGSRGGRGPGAECAGESHETDPLICPLAASADPKVRDADLTWEGPWHPLC